MSITVTKKPAIIFSLVLILIHHQEEHGNLLLLYLHFDQTTKVAQMQ